MPVVISQNRDVMRAALSGEIDHHTAKELREDIDNALQCAQPRRLVLDFSGVGFMDSSGIGLIMGRYRLTQEWGCRVELTGAPPSIARMIRLAGLGRLGIDGV